MGWIPSRRLLLTSDLSNGMSLKWSTIGDVVFLSIDVPKLWSVEGLRPRGSPPSRVFFLGPIVVTWWPDDCEKRRPTAEFKLWLVKPCKCWSIYRVRFCKWGYCRDSLSIAVMLKPAGLRMLGYSTMWAMFWLPAALSTLLDKENFNELF